MSENNLLCEALCGAPEVFISELVTRYEQSPLRIPPQQVPASSIRFLVEPLIDSFRSVFLPAARDKNSAPSNAKAPLSLLVVGSPATKEIEKAAGFVGARLGADQVRGFEVAAIFGALREQFCALVLDDSRDIVQRYFEWLLIIALDALAGARVEALREQQRELLERATPVFWIGDLPAVFFIGEVDTMLLHSIFSRLLLAVVRFGATAVLLDTTAMISSTRDSTRVALSQFLAHCKVRGLTTLHVIGLLSEERSSWQFVAREHEIHIDYHEVFDQAVRAAWRQTGTELVKER